MIPNDSGKYENDRRPGLPKEHPIRFYARFWWETLRKQARLLAMYLRYERTQRRVLREPPADLSDDIAMQPAGIGDLDGLELFHATASARTIADRAKRTAALRATRLENAALTDSGHPLVGRGQAVETPHRADPTTAKSTAT